jgi:hypothetical protein
LTRSAGGDAIVSLQIAVRREKARSLSG